MDLNKLSNDNGPTAPFDSQQISRAQIRAIPALIVFAETINNLIEQPHSYPYIIFAIELALTNLKEKLND